MTESEVQQLIQIEAAKYGLVLMRNNSGVLKDAEGRPVRYGLGNVSAHQNLNFKSSDLIGCLPVVITQEMVGQTIGQFVAVEVKKPGWNPKNYNDRERAQHNFLEFIRSKGGLGFFASSVDGLVALLKRS